MVLMSIENLSRTSNNIKTLDMNLDVLKQNIKVANHKKICINALKQRLILNKKKDLYKYECFFTQKSKSRNKRS